MEELLNKKNELLKQLEKVNKEINNYNDGYLYKVITFVYGSKKTYDFTNTDACMMFTDEFNGDNGLTKTFTNNPDFIDLNDDCTHFVDNPNDVTTYNYEKFVK